MLEVRAPWDQKVIQKIKYQKANDIDKILELASKNSLKKGADFSLIKRIEVLESFYKSILKYH